MPWTLTLAGPGPHVPCRPLATALEDPRVRWAGVLPHPELLREMERHHVLVFPSLAEGFGLVVGEALSRGLPVIATEATRTRGLVREGIEGYVVPIRDPASIARHLARLYENEDLHLAMAQAARRRAAELAWKRYEDRITALLHGILGGIT